MTGRLTCTCFTARRHAARAQLQADQQAATARLAASGWARGHTWLRWHFLLPHTHTQPFTSTDARDVLETKDVPLSTPTTLWS